MSNSNIRIGERIKIIRKSKKITQKELAEKVGVTHEWICKLENGKANVTLSLLNNIADNLTVELEQLMVS